MKRGRRPIGRKAMTPAQRQARRRKRLQVEAAQRQGQEPPRRLYQPPYGYGPAKERMIAEGHTFERARREFGFEEGVFVDGAYLSSHEVIAFAELSIEDRQQRLAEARLASKTFACTAVQSYMEALQVTLDDLTHDPNARAIRTWREEALLVGR